MRVRFDHLRRIVTIEMSPTEFSETVEWLEMLSPHDGATREWRTEHERVMPRPAPVDGPPDMGGSGG